ncbi:hypothetical protein MBLNU459_g3187t1 [Dothideomycetes sp. NU459]
MESQKPIHTIVLDTGAIIRNDPSVSTLLAQSENIVTVPAIISEIRDAATRSRVETTLQPFLTLRSPNLASIKFVSDFARRTGDLAVLSKPDIQIIALAYELECERNNGDWRLRKAPGQKGLNGSPPKKDEPSNERTGTEDAEPRPDVTQDVEVENATVVPESTQENPEENVSGGGAPKEVDGESAAIVSESAEADALPAVSSHDAVAAAEAAQGTSNESVTATIPPVDSCVELDVQEVPAADPSAESNAQEVEGAMARTNLGTEQEDETIDTADAPEAAQDTQEAADASDDSDSEGWITPSNLKKHQAKDAAGSVSQGSEPKTMQVATLTTDFAMQNVILQINLNLLSPSMQRVKHLKTFVLRCHACFQTTKEMGKQFCPRCGKPTLTRVACSTNANGEFKLHLKKNMQWNHRGDRYSIPKAVHGSSNGRVVGGGKGGWGNELILAEDQKEYMRAMSTEKRRKERDLMDEDYLPSILTGDRSKTGGRLKVGAGRTVNSRKR